MNRLGLIAIKPIKWLKTTHSKLQQPQDDGTIPYLVAYEWTVDIISYGLLLTFVYVNLFIVHGVWKILMFIVTFGLIRWLLFDMLEETVNKIKGKT